MITSHLERLHAGLAKTKLTFASWIKSNIILNGKPFGFLDHEYQETILNDTNNKKVVKKCSQVGLSALNLCRALAFVSLQAGVKLSYVLPSAKFAQKFVKMRLDPLINASPNVAARLEKGNDSSELKQIGDSFLMSQGASASSTTNVLAIDLDALVVDELDGAESHDVINQLISRLIHSKLKDEFYLSTPTVPGYGISLKFDNSRQHVLLQKCTRCNQWFKPDYYKHVHLPGFSNRGHDLSEISYLNSNILNDFDLKTATVLCPNPKCRRPLPLSHISDPSTREFVCENVDSKAEFHGYHISPFAIPAIITPGSLIARSSRYSRLQDFYNDALGLELASKETGLSLEEIETFFRSTPLVPYSTSNTSFSSTDTAVQFRSRDFQSIVPFTLMGLDMGGQCACTIAAPISSARENKSARERDLSRTFTSESSHARTQLRIIHAEMIPLHLVRKRVDELYSEFNVATGVVDSLPYTDSVLMLQEKHPTLYASIFSKKRGLSLYDVTEQNVDDPVTAMSLVRSISVARDRGFDLLVSALRNKVITFDPLPAQRSTYTEHMMDLKRIFVAMTSNQFLSAEAGGEGKFVWRKTRGVDHYFFSLLYVFLAFCMNSGIEPVVAMQNVPLISTFKLKNF